MALFFLHIFVVVFAERVENFVISYIYFYLKTHTESAEQNDIECAEEIVRRCYKDLA